MLILQLNQLFREIKFVYNFVCDDDIAFISVAFDKNYAICVNRNVSNYHRGRCGNEIYFNCLFFFFIGR